MNVAYGDNPVALLFCGMHEIWLSPITAYTGIHGDRGSTVVKVLCYRQFVGTAVAQWLRCCATDSLLGPR